MTIDAHQIKRVRDRIDRYMADEAGCVIDKHLTAEDLNLAARVLAAYAATLPREVPLEAWAVVRPDGTILEILHDMGDATASAITHKYVVIPLTGTAVIPPREKD
jgi:hypothetical protein